MRVHPSTQMGESLPPVAIALKVKPELHHTLREERLVARSRQLLPIACTDLEGDAAVRRTYPNRVKPKSKRIHNTIKSVTSNELNDDEVLVLRAMNLEGWRLGHILQVRVEEVELVAKHHCSQENSAKISFLNTTRSSENRESEAVPLGGGLSAS